jgi:hypothetical protein
MVNFLEQRCTDNFRFPQSSKNQIWGFALKEKNKKFHVGVLSPHTLKVRVHFVRGQAPSICQKMFFATDDPDAVCAECEKPNEKYPGKPILPSQVLLFLGSVLELRGKKGHSKAGKEYDENPTKVIAIPSGKGKINWGPIVEAIQEDDDFMEHVWRLEDALDGDRVGFQPPSKANLKKLGEQFDLSVIGEERAKYEDKSEGEIFSILIAAYAGVKWDDLDMIDAGFENPYPPENEAKEEKEEEPEVDIDSTSILG